MLHPTPSPIPINPDLTSTLPCLFAEEVPCAVAHHLLPFRENLCRPAFGAAQEYIDSELKMLGATAHVCNVEDLRIVWSFGALRVLPRQ